MPCTCELVIIEIEIMMFSSVGFSVLGGWTGKTCTFILPFAPDRPFDFCSRHIFYFCHHLSVLLLSVLLLCSAALLCCVQKLPLSLSSSPQESAQRKNLLEFIFFRIPAADEQILRKRIRALRPRFLINHHNFLIEIEELQPRRYETFHRSLIAV